MKTVMESPLSVVKKAWLLLSNTLFLNQEQKPFSQQPSSHSEEVRAAKKHSVLRQWAVRSYAWLSTGITLASQAATAIAQQTDNQPTAASKHASLRSRRVSDQVFVDDVTDGLLGRPLSSTVLELKGGSIKFEEGNSSAFFVENVVPDKVLIQPDGSKFVVATQSKNGVRHGYLAQYNRTAFVKGLKLRVDALLDFSCIALTEKGSIVMVANLNATNTYFDSKHAALVIQMNSAWELEWASAFYARMGMVSFSCAARDGIIVVAGGCNFHGLTSHLLVQLDHNGDVEDAYEADGSFRDYQWGFNDVQITPDSIKFVAPSYYRFRRTPSIRLFSLKYFSEVSAWNYAFTLKSYFDYYLGPFENLKLHLRQDGGFIVYGEVNLFAGSTSTRCMIVVKIDSHNQYESGILLYRTGGLYLESLAVLNNGSIVLGGGQVQSYTDYSSRFKGRALIVQLSPENEIEWEIKYGPELNYVKAVVMGLDVSEDKLIAVGSFAGASGNDSSVDHIMFSEFNPHDGPRLVISDNWLFRRELIGHYGVYNLQLEYSHNMPPTGGRTPVHEAEKGTINIEFEAATSQLSAKVFAVNPNMRGFPPIQPAAVMHHWSYILPEELYKPLPQQPVVRLDDGGSEWLAFDPKDRKLHGTPGDGQSGQITLRLLPERLNLPGVGSFSFQPILMHLDVARTGRGMGWLRDDAAHGTLLVPILTQAFNKSFSLNLRSILADGVDVVSIFACGQTQLPGWLIYDSAKGILSGFSKGTVRGMYPLSMNLVNGQLSQQVSFAINVTNTPPEYMGEPEFNVPLGPFNIPLGSFFRDAEGDLISQFGLSLIGSRWLPALGGINPVTGMMSGTAQSEHQGEYIINMTASDATSTGWKQIVFNVLDDSEDNGINPILFVFAAAAFLLASVVSICYFSRKRARPLLPENSRGDSEGVGVEPSLLAAGASSAMAELKGATASSPDNGRRGQAYATASIAASSLNSLSPQASSHLRLRHGFRVHQQGAIDAPAGDESEYHHKI